MKRKTKTKVRFTISNFEAVKGKFLLDIKRVKMIEEIPDELVINWDQTGIKFLCGRWLRRDPREGVMTRGRSLRCLQTFCQFI